MSNEKTYMNIDETTRFVNVVKNKDDDYANPFTDFSENLCPHYYEKPVLIEKNECSFSDNWFKNVNLSSERKGMCYQFEIGEDNNKIPYKTTVDCCHIYEDNDVYQFSKFRSNEISVMPKEIAVKVLNAAKEQYQKDCLPPEKKKIKNMDMER